MAHGRRPSKGAGPAAGAGRYELTLSSRALPRALLIAALALLVCHTALAVYHYRVQQLPWLLRQLFDVDQENNLPTWYSAFMLLTASALLWICARGKRAEGDRWFRHWYALAAGFLLMSLDEVAGLHETINSMIVMTWAIGGAILALVIGLAFLPFLLDLPRRTAVRFGAAGAVYLTGAIGIEIVGNSLVGKRLEDTLQYNLTTLAEESLEMIGVILFLHSLMRYMRRPRTRSVSASLEVT